MDLYLTTNDGSPTPLLDPSGAEFAAWCVSTDNDPDPVFDVAVDDVEGARRETAHLLPDGTAWVRVIHPDTLADLGNPSVAFVAAAQHVVNGPGATMVYDYATGDPLRRGTPDELADSAAQAEKDGGAGVIEIDGRSVYVR